MNHGADGSARRETEVTGLLRRLDAGDEVAGEALLPLLYEELHGRAESLMRGQGSAHTLQATALVNEAWLRLQRHGEWGWNSRSHFLGVAAKAMRSILVDHARTRSAQKRGGAATTVPLDEAIAALEVGTGDLLRVDEALERLAGFDPELARIVELRFFGGSTRDDTARVLGISNTSVDRGWRTARAWLRKALED